MRLEDLRPLGRSGFQASRIGLGCTTFGREIDSETSFAVMDRAFELGIRLFDTAEAYGGGLSEKIIGHWLRSRGVRDEIVLLTKKSRNHERARVRESLAASLERLQTDRVDMYLYHQFDPFTPPEEAVSAMDDVVQSGLARAGGCSNYTAAQLSHALEISRSNGGRRFEIIENNYNLAVPGITEDMLPLCRREQIGVLGYSPLGAGFLTGKYTPDRTMFPLGSRFDVVPGHADVYFSDRNFRVLERLLAFADRVHVPAHLLAIAWVFQNPDVTSVLVGARRIEHLDNAVEALAMEFPPDWLAEMNSWN